MDAILSTAACGLDAAKDVMLRAAKTLRSSVPSVPETVKGMMDLTRANTLVKSGVAVVRTASEVLGTIVDLIA